MQLPPLISAIQCCKTLHNAPNNRAGWRHTLTNTLLKFGSEKEILNNFPSTRREVTIRLLIQCRVLKCKRKSINFPSLGKSNSKSELQKASSTSSAKFLPLNVQITLKNTIFTACKWSKLCKYYVNSMVISCITCQKEEKECTWVNLWFTQSFDFVLIYAIFPPNSDSQIFIIDNKNAYCKSAVNVISLFFCQDGNWDKKLWGNHSTVWSKYSCYSLGLN